jgi:CDP-diacylglycerol--serine O-phosphatidyltransferase
MTKVTRSVIPSLFTMMNLFSGFIAIKTAMIDSNYVAAGWFIVLGGIFDMLDGMMARLTHSSSEFGVELDSLADVVTFGVGPSAIIYKLFFIHYGGIGLLLGALPAICGALRLARFNVELVGFDKNYFKGLPIPSAAFLIVSYVTFYYLRQSPAVGHETYDIGMFVVVLSAAFLMVSNVKYDTIPKFSGKAVKANPLKFSLFAIGVILSLVTKGSALFPLFVLFIIFGVIRSLIERVKRAIIARKASALLDEEQLSHEEEDAFGL